MGISSIDLYVLLSFWQVKFHATHERTYHMMVLLMMAGEHVYPCLDVLWNSLWLHGVTIFTFNP